MRHLVPVLSLLAACAVDPLAPAIEPSGADRGGVPAVNQSIAELTAELEAAHQAIAELSHRLDQQAAQLEVQGGDLRTLDDAVLTLGGSVGTIAGGNLRLQGELDLVQSTLEVHGGNLQAHDSALLRLSDSVITVQGGNLQLRDEVDLMQSTLRVHGGSLQAHDSALLGLGDSVVTLQGGNLRLQGQIDLMQSTLDVHGGDLQLHDSALFRTDPQSGLTVDRLADLELRAAIVEGFAILLAGGNGTCDTADDLYATLFTTDEASGEPAPSVAGVTAELRKRPDLLFGEWDALIDQHVSSALANPLTQIDGLWDELSRLDADLRLQEEATACLQCSTRPPDDGGDTCVEQRDGSLLCGRTDHL
jgi:hypothetical protein